MTKDIDWNDVGFFAIVGAVVVFLLWFIIAGLCATDSENWTPTTNSKACYLHTEHVRNMWLTPGDTYTLRDTYCKDK